MHLTLYNFIFHIDKKLVNLRFFWSTRLKTGSIFGCNTFRPIDSMSGDKGLWVPGDCLTTQTTIATAYSPQSSDSDKPIGSVR